MDFSLASKETKQSRLEACQNCKSSKNDLLGLTCGKFGKKTRWTCGCLIKAKIQFNNQKCPQKKW